MEKFILRFDQESKTFIGKFNDVSKTLIQRLKEKGLLERVTEDFIEKLPETISGEIHYDPDARDEEDYWLFFYLDLKLPDMNATQTYLNRDINIEEDGEVTFNFLAEKELGTQTSEKEIVYFF